MATKLPDRSQLPNTPGTGAQADDATDATDAETISTSSMNEFLRTRGLDEIPGDNNNEESMYDRAGVSIDSAGRLRISSPPRSQRAHLTALVLDAAPVSLTEYDFARILKRAKNAHAKGAGSELESGTSGWRSRGGLRKSESFVFSCRVAWYIVATS